jgi:uncharacterized membrane protein
VGFDRSARDFWPRIAAAILALAGSGITTYLVWERYHGNAPVCALGGGCLTVQRSEWATVAGVPVAILGLVAYVGMFVCALVPRQIAALGSLFLSLLGVMLSGYLTYLELFSIHAVCEWCVTSAVVVTLLLVASVIRLMWLDDPGAVSAA